MIRQTRFEHFVYGRYGFSSPLSLREPKSIGIHTAKVVTIIIKENIIETSPLHFFALGEEHM